MEMKRHDVDLKSKINHDELWGTIWEHEVKMKEG
jgi:hypothetical protein